MKKSVAVMAALLGIWGTVRAQQIVDLSFLEDGDFVVFEDGQMPVASSAPANGEAPKEESERSKRLKALVFDRRPSVILAEWSKPPKSPEDEAAESSEGEPDAHGDAGTGGESEAVADAQGSAAAAAVPGGLIAVGGSQGPPSGSTLVLAPASASPQGTSVQGVASVPATPLQPASGATSSSAPSGTAAATTTPSAQQPIAVTLTPAVPATRAQTPVAGTQTSAAGTQAPAAGTQAPAAGSQTPATTSPATTSPAAATTTAPAADGSSSATDAKPEGEAAATKEGESASGEGAGSDEQGSDAGGSDATASGTEAVEELSEEAKAAQAAEKKAAEEAEAARQKAEAERKAAEEKALVAELELFQHNVTLGLWGEVKTYLAGLEEEEGKVGYKQLLASLVKGAPKAQGQFAAYGEVNFYDPSDIYGLIDCAPIEFEVADLDAIGKLLSECVRGGSLIEHCIDRFRAGLEAEVLEIEPTELARILMTAGSVVEAGEFLPEPEVAQAENDRPALNLLARYFLAKYAEEPKTIFLEKAWGILQNALADGEVDEKDKEEALKRAVEIAPRISEELGQAWLDESFSERPARGMEILRVIGASASTGLFAQARVSDVRFKGLKLQTTATNALITAAPELANEWSEALNLLAGNWLKEANFTYQYDKSTQRGPAMQRDYYGNFFYYDYNQYNQNRNMPEAIKTSDMLDIRPSDEWLARVDPGLQPKFTMVIAQLLLKLNEEAEAFPYIESLARANPKRGEELVEEFLRVWTKNHNPNSENQRTNPYMFIYGFEQRANGIPLTRSKQERNLVELAEWVGRLRALPIESLDEELIATAFTTAHSSAEVYRLETIERVFGALGDLEPKTLAELVQKMRQNLVSVWREPATQKDAKTNRRQKDIQLEVFRGYEVAQAVIEKSLADHPDDWSLVLARASLLHDENNFSQEVKKSTEFAGKRQAAFAEFQRAAQLYADAVLELGQEKETTKVFDVWFYSSLGACDLNAINDEKVPVEAQYALIRAALESLPGETAERHMDMFANNLFTRMSSVGPTVKYGYVRAGLEIVGDNERAGEAREVFDYYSDLITEIRLEARVDGSDRVSKDQPFGLFVDIVHTREIEREAGGFSKYLINQNNQRFSYNYGRPTENYRDKFEEIVRSALSEHFEVLSITFNHPETNSQATEEYGWRVTPYAYLLLRSHGSEVDKIPPLRLDLDFLDTSGYAILPIESSPIVLDATAPEPTARPYRDLSLTQTLDERQSDDGRLILEVQARAIGLVPDFDEIVDLAPEGFEIVSTDDQGLSVSKFDEEGDGRSVVSDRTWMVRMQAKEGLEKLPEEFTFAAAKVETKESDFQRFVDADLEKVERTIPLLASYGERSHGREIGLGLGLLLLAGLGWLGFRSMNTGGPKVDKVARYKLPESLSPFTVIGLLRDIDQTGGVADSQRGELVRDIEQLEGYYFGTNGHQQPDLDRLAKVWVERAR